MLEHVQVPLITDLMEIIHVQLSHERGKVPMSEMQRQDLFLESFDFQNGKECSILAPVHNGMVVLVLSQGGCTSRI